jgi:hypothetical protein
MNGVDADSVALSLNHWRGLKRVGAKVKNVKGCCLFSPLIPDLVRVGKKELTD